MSASRSFYRVSGLPARAPCEGHAGSSASAFRGLCCCCCGGRGGGGGRAHPRARDPPRPSGQRTHCHTVCPPHMALHTVGLRNTLGAERGPGRSAAPSLSCDVPFPPYQQGFQRGPRGGRRERGAGGPHFCLRPCRTQCRLALNSQSSAQGKKCTFLALHVPCARLIFVSSYHPLPLLGQHHDGKRCQGQAGPGLGSLVGLRQRAQQVIEKATEYLSPSSRNTRVRHKQQPSLSQTFVTKS